MDKIKFHATHFWNKETMNFGDLVTDKQWQQVYDICKTLDAKYKLEMGCNIHPDRVQEIQIGIFNDYVDIQVTKPDTCCCQNIVERLLEIRNTEMFLLNPNHFKDKQSLT